MEQIINKAYFHYNKALNLIENKKISSAKEELKKALNLYQEDIDILNLMGVCEYYYCNFEQAYRYWYKSKNTINDKNDANEFIDFLSSTKYEKLVINYNKAIDYIYQKKYNEAIIVLKGIVNEYADLIEPVEMIVMCYLELNKNKEARGYIDKLLEKDSSNINYLQAKNQINSGVSFKIKRKKENKIKTILIILVIVLTFVLIMLLSLLNSKKISYNQALSSSNSKYDMLLEKYDEEKTINEKLSRKVEILNLDSDESKFILFNKYINEYSSSNYKEALKGFEYIIEEYPKKEYIRSEATYFAAKSARMLKKYEDAKEYYEIYINEYKNENYYDDCLYSYGLMLNDLDEKNKSKEVLEKLVRYKPNSEFINSKVTKVINQ
ncbi:tetratricopeptide repeat protein [Romboutsia sp.]|uniref:tetratricopeptide repeat protein n=1 Tax=Romboutsia sp. TaxID=1965302 RepID=UPI003F315734